MIFDHEIPWDNNFLLIEAEYSESLEGVGSVEYWGSKIQGPCERVLELQGWKIVGALNKDKSARDLLPGERTLAFDFVSNNEDILLDQLYHKSV